MPKCQKSTAIANSLSAKTRATAADGGLRVAAQSATRCAAHGSGDVNANAVWLLSESESLKKPSRRNSCSAFTSAFKRPKGRYFRTKKTKIKPLTTENAYHFECHSLLKSLFYRHFGIFQPKMIHFS